MVQEWSLALWGDHDGDVLARIETSRAGLTVVRSCSTLAELLGAAQSGIAQAALLVEPDEELTASSLNALRACGVTVVLLQDPDSAQNPFDLVTVAPEAGAEVIAQAIELAASPERVCSLRTVEDSSSGAEDAALEASKQIPSSERMAESAPRGLCWTVWGPLGSPGASTVALNLAAEAVYQGLRVCLIDAHTYGASQAAMLGLLEESAGISRACRAAERGSLTPEQLEQMTETVALGPHRLQVLTGITRADRWIEVRDHALEAVIHTARQSFDRVILDVAFSVERSEEAFYEVAAPQRNAATITAVEQADRVVCIGRADVLGIPRLIKAMEEGGLLQRDEEPLVVLNHAPVGPGSETARQELLQAWTRFGPRVEIGALLPVDPAAGYALAQGSTLVEGFRRSPLRSALHQLWIQLDPAGIDSSADSPQLDRGSSRRGIPGSRLLRRARRKLS